jgi:hypothetical protein
MLSASRLMDSGMTGKLKRIGKDAVMAQSKYTIPPFSWRN